jgi:hypothetical protein
VIRFVILGQPASKANSREIGKKRMFSKKKGASVLVPLLRKSDAALDYEAHAQKQIPAAARMEYQRPVRVTIRIFYRTELPDLDESVVLDVLQSKFVKVIDRYEHVGEGQYRKVLARKQLWRGVYLNDRQVREKHIYHGIDKKNPRAEIEVELITPELL